jgi:hypothetical protein
MKNVQLFSATTIQDLQIKINQWLTINKDAHIIETNITSLTKINSSPALDSPDGEYVFYILFTPAMEAEEESVFAASKQMPSELMDSIIISTENN